MKPKQFFFIMTGLTSIFGVFIIASAVGGNMLFKEQAKKLNELKVQSKVADQRQTDLIQAKKDIAKYSELDKTAKSVVPQDKDQAKTVREIISIAAQSGIQIQSITFQASNLGDAKALPPSQTSNDTSSSSSSAPTKSLPKISQVVPVDGIPGVFALEIVVSPNSSVPIPYDRFLNFLERLEANRRTAHVDKINVTPVPNSYGITFNLTLDAYVKP